MGILDAPFLGIIQYNAALKDNLEASKNIPSKKCFWPTQVCQYRFSKRFNLYEQQSEGTMYSRTGLLCQLVPSLEMTYALRKIFNIPAGKGRILNIDESLTYRFDEKAKSWGF